LTARAFKKKKFYANSKVADSRLLIINYTNQLRQLTIIRRLLRSLVISGFLNDRRRRSVVGEITCFRIFFADLFALIRNRDRGRESQCDN